MKVNKRIWAAALSAVLFIGSISTPALAFVDESAATADAEETTGTLPEVSIETEIEPGAAEADDSLFDTNTGEKGSEEEEPENNTVFTPDGTGTVMDTATDTDGKEFYTITTESGAVYYLIIDNERTENNVYFLNVVTEEDLLPLAEGTGDTTETDIPATVTPTPDTDAPADDTDTDSEDKAVDSKTTTNSKSLILIVIAVIAAGAAGYYLKIYKPKHMAPSYDEDEDDFDDDNYDDDDEYLDDDSDSEDYLYRDEEEDD